MSVESLIGQWGLIAFLVFYYFYGARLVGALLAAALRPIRGLEARPLYWEGGIAALFPMLGLWLWPRLPSEAPIASLGFILGSATLGGFLLWDWAKRRLWLEGDALKAEGLFRRPLHLPLEAVTQARLVGGYDLAIDRSDGRPPIRAPLSMDGLDSLYAALLRAGVKGPSFEDFQAARKRLRRR